MLGVIPPHKPVVPSTISGWVKKIYSNVRIKAFFSFLKQKFTRSASSSSAIAFGVSFSDIFRGRNSSGGSTWRKSYEKDIVGKDLGFQNPV